MAKSCMRCVGIDNRQCRVELVAPVQAVASAQVVAAVQHNNDNHTDGQHDKHEKEVVLKEDPDKKAEKRDIK